MNRFYIKNKKTNDINYCSAFESREDAITRLNLMFDVVVKKDRTIDLHKDGQLVTTVLVVEKDLGNFYLADIVSGALLKAHFDSPENAIDFMYDTYDEVEFNINNGLFMIRHKGTTIGAFEVVGG